MSSLFTAVEPQNIVYSYCSQQYKRS